MAKPLFSYKADKIKLIINIKENSVLKIIASIIIVWSIYSIIYYSTYAFIALSGDIGQNRLEIISNRNIPANYFTFFASVGGNMFYFAQFLFFVGLTLNWPRKFLILLAVSSFSVIIHVLANVGRDGFVLWLFSYLLYYLLFKKLLIAKQIKLIKRVNLIVVIAGVVIISMITVSRFGASQYYEGDVLYSLIDYNGQQLTNFNQSFEYIENIEKRYYLTPNLKKNVLELLQINSTSFSEDLNFHADELNYFGVKSFVFRTFVMDLLMNFGYLGTIAFAFIYNLILIILIRTKQNAYTFSRILLISMLVQIPLFGVFYFRQYISDFDYGILIILVILLILKMLKSGKSFILNPVNEHEDSNN